MKKDIKQEILAAGLRLFTDCGYAKVTMRMIADALGISVGNLTYHFKTKEDLIEAVLLDGYRDFVVPAMPTTPGELYDLFNLAVEDQKRADYFFRFYDQLEKISPRLYALQVAAIQRRRRNLQQAFALLRSDGHLQEEEFPGHHDALIDVLNMIKIHWTPGDGAYPEAQDSPMNLVRGIMLPVLTKKGKAAFRETKR